MFENTAASVCIKCLSLIAKPRSKLHRILPMRINPIVPLFQWKQFPQPADDDNETKRMNEVETSVEHREVIDSVLCKPRPCL